MQTKAYILEYNMNEIQTIQNKIYEIRGQRVMLDFDLAAMYGVETRRLNEQVKRNIERFPEDFMFQLTKGELEILRSQIATSNTADNQEDDYWISQIATSNFAKMGLRKALVCSSMPSVPHWLSYSQKSQDQSQGAESGSSKTTTSPNRQKNRPLPFYSIF